MFFITDQGSSGLVYAIAGACASTAWSREKTHERLAGHLRPVPWQLSPSQLALDRGC
jgi:hypothetical protein